MEKFQSPRQNKINSALQKEIAYLLQGIIRKENISNLMISVTKINVSPDLSSAKVYLSILIRKLRILLMKIYNLELEVPYLWLIQIIILIY